jgi:glycosyltransferase involved in cell wall biosynthesis
MRVVMLAVDGRECYRDYAKEAPYFGPAQEALFQGVSQFSEIEMHVISCWQRPLPAPEKLASNIWFHGLVVPKIGWLRTGYQGCIRAVRRKARALGPDLVHAQGTERDVAISAVFSGSPNLVTIHGNMNALARLHHARIGSFLWCTARLEDFTLKRTGGVFCNSAYTESLVRRRTSRTWRVANPIRTEFFEPPSTASPDRDCVLVNVGVISELKRQLQLLKLAEQLHGKGLKFELQFIGRADRQLAYAREFLDKIRQAEKAGYARYLGVKSGRELVNCFDHAHGMIHIPSAESFGLVVAEALARNLKFFGSKVGGIVDIASQAEGAELIDEHDWSGLGAAIANWIKNGYSRPTAAAGSIRKRYHPSLIAGMHLEIYEQFLSRQAHRL